MKRRDHIKRMAKKVQTDQGHDDTLQRITTLNIERNPPTHTSIRENIFKFEIFRKLDFGAGRSRLLLT